MGKATSLGNENGNASGAQAARQPAPVNGIRKPETETQALSQLTHLLSTALHYTLTVLSTKH